MKRRITYMCFIVLLTITLIMTLTLGILRRNKLKLENKKDYDIWMQSKTSPDPNDNLIFYKKLKNKQNVNILVLGDDLALSKGKSETHPGWLNLLVYYVESSFGNKTYLQSLAQNGDTIVEGKNIVSSNPNLENFDLIITCFGKNDSINKLPLASFTQNYTELIQTLKYKNPNCIILFMLPNTLSENNIYRDEIQNIANNNNLKCIDMLTQFKNSKVELSNLVNNDIPNDNGYNLYAVTLNDIIQNEVSKLK
ncbi:hypothetical protein CLPUN_30590 [Clostridium puniceum]|uniref:SGNH hydrolase-type esterase domain-containing protein n=1 Tax=Clostridium puniceum TaxID=29367 RepID=A0A1S8TEJ3_9CLOT|nr:SGNH/GDSL hydrolase family protein [Clostridium puniceum]OOM75825.1 hypothetical protein CLPUN_30590 [Clostridium puniceum]